MIRNVLKASPVKCCKCGRDVKVSEDRIRQGEDSFMCRLCYVEMLYPALRAADMEFIDQGMEAVP